MAATTLSPAAGQAAGVARPSRRWHELPVLLALAALLAATLSLALLLLAQRPPGDDSAEAGFARDMSVHHAQAVEMAEIVRDRTADPEVRVLATDIALTQQAQIGQVQGWLDVWGLPATGRDPPMAWMGMAVDGQMPGMASPEEVARLRQLPPEEMDAAFLRLMIPHHRAAVRMAEAVLARTQRPEVRRLAEAIVASQQAEIEAMQDVLRRKGQPPVAIQPPLAGRMDGGAGTRESRDGRTVMEQDGTTAMQEHETMGMQDEGFAASVPAVARDTARLAPLPLALFALGWLGLNALRQRRASVGAAQTDAPRLWQALAVAGLGASALLHVGLVPEHFEEAAAYGIFFAVAGGALAVAAAAVLAWPSRPVYLGGAALSLALVGLYVLFRLVPPPGAEAVEEVDLVGLVAKATELVAAGACMLLWFQSSRTAARPVAAV